MSRGVFDGTNTPNQITLSASFKPISTGLGTSGSSRTRLGVDTSSARVGVNISEREVAQLPLNGRQISQLYLLVPGATNTGTGNGLPASGKHLALRGITIWRVTNGRLSEEWSEFDEERVKEWLSKGAKPSGTVSRLLKVKNLS